ncbi:hypothetical protein [Snuella sedimenti]|uniref:Co-chaperone DjlA N-terminal domain-containing protein n=1 Tax=Snuella sedimenti TaxID=2798802 RepID=A0A8J7J365_9FLAO|nr:hypothetical protein [Snuella sedimenti]MBJ6367493.1 hypothetical protein [Snuella sedimenti]
MRTKKHMTLGFYQNLGKLFYAIAAADHVVNPKEFETLKELVKKQWLEVDDINDTFGTDAAYQIEIVFDWLNTHETDLSIEQYFNDFVNYKNEQKHLFTDTVNKLIIKTASAIAASFSGINKSELILLAKLDMELKK